LPNGTLLPLLSATLEQPATLDATLEQGEGIQRASPAKRWVVLTAAAAAAAAAASEAVLAKGGGEGSVTVIDT